MKTNPPSPCLRPDGPRRRRPWLLFALAATLAGAQTTQAPALLREVADRWTKHPQQWAFTQLARETSSDGTVHERLERFDPSRGDSRRWRLLRLDGRLATPAEVVAWSDRKNGPRKSTPKSVDEYVDLERARVLHEDADSVSYNVPLRRLVAGLVPTDKVEVTLTLNKRTREIERAQASIDAPFNVALGLARIVDLDLDLVVPAASAPAGQAAAKPGQAEGTASAVVNKFGRRVEYNWSDFTLVSPPGS